MLSHFIGHVSFPTCFMEGKGFDAVVGNPPYVRQELLVPSNPYLKRAFAAFDGSADLYVYFYEAWASHVTAWRTPFFDCHITSG